MKSLEILIIVVSFGMIFVTSAYAESQDDIPPWIKGVAGFWAEGKITDDEFKDGISFLIDNNIIKINQIIKLEDKIEQINFEKKKLLDELDNYNKTTNIESLITVSTDRSSYDKGENVTVSGKVTNFEKDKTVSFIVRDPKDNLVVIDQITPDSSGKFTHSFYAGGALWYHSGTYTIEYNYQSAKTQISFIYNDPRPYAQSILVTTNKVQYNNGEVIEISGRVSEYLEGVPIGIRLYDPYGELVKILMSKVNSDNTFNAKITANGESFQQPGIYTIKTIQGTESRSAKVPVEFILPSSGVTSIHFVKPLYTTDENFVFTGIENKGNQDIYVVIHDPFGVYVGTVLGTSAEDGMFYTDSMPVSEFFTKKGHYTAVAFTDEQNAINGVTMNLDFDGIYIAETN